MRKSQSMPTINRRKKYVKIQILRKNLRAWFFARTETEPNTSAEAEKKLLLDFYFRLSNENEVFFPVELKAVFTLMEFLLEILDMAF